MEVETDGLQVEAKSVFSIPDRITIVTESFGLVLLDFSAYEA